MAEEQNVYITGHALADWSTEATQTQIHGSLKQIQADGNAMIRFLHHIANGTKVSADMLAKATNEIKTSTGLDKTTNKKELAQGGRIVQTSQKIASGTLASISAITGLRDDYLDSERKQKKRDGIRDALLDANYTEDAANKGADRKMQLDLYKKIGATLFTFAASVKTVADVLKEGVGQSFNERFAMVAEMRQSGLLASMSGAEAGFEQMAKTISATNFTFGEATQFTKQFAKTVGVLGVKSALSFANTVADSRIENGMGYMEKYALEFGQVSNIAGEYLDTLRIGGQLRGIDDKSMRTGMDDFMSNVEMTSNVLKISMEDAADLMKKAFGPEDVALLATLPAEQRDAIEEGFLAMGAQGNPMAETLAKRLAAGSKGAFQHTAEWQEMVGTAPGREVLDFVEQMAQQLENGDTGSFQSALAEGFPKLAESLIELSSRGGVRIQLLNEPQLASMVGQIIEAAQTYGDADKGTKMGADQPEEKAHVRSMIQIREALVASETAMNVHMERFVENLVKYTAVQTDLADKAALLLASHKGFIGLSTDISTWWSEVKGYALSEIFKQAAEMGETDKEFQKYQKRFALADDQFASKNESMDATYDEIMKKYTAFAADAKSLSFEEREHRADKLRAEIAEALYDVKHVISSNAEKIEGSGKLSGIWEENLKQLLTYATKLDDFTESLK